MKRGGLAAAVVAIFLLAGGSAEAQDCSPQPFGVDPVNGNFTPIVWDPDPNDLQWVNSAVGAQFLGVWANTDFDMWFVGFAGSNRAPPIAAHFDGFSLHPYRLPGIGWLTAVWGSASNDVWAVGINGLIEHWDGTQWVSVPSGTGHNLVAVSGTASDDVWAAGAKVMLHWDGSSWSNSPSFVPDLGDNLSGGLAAISRDDAVVATYYGCQRWDGASWQRTACGVQGGRGIFATGSNDVWVVGFIQPEPDDFIGYRAHWDGASWTTTTALYRRWSSIGGTGPTDIWIDGMLHYDGSTWTEMSCGPQFDAMSVSTNGAIMGVNQKGIEYFSGNDGWPFLGRTLVNWIAVGGTSPTNVFAVGSRGAVIHYDGSSWSGRDFPLPQADEYLFSAFGSSASDIWGTSSQGFRHFDGSRWTVVDVPVLLQTGFARAPNDAIAMDNSAHPWHWDGTSWWQITLPIFGNDTIMEFWGTGPNDVWAVGGHYQSDGAIYHWDGDSWQRIYVTTAGDVAHVGGSAVDDVWFTIRRPDYQTTVLHWDGGTFSDVGLINGPPLAIAASNPNNVWLRQNPGWLHYDGTNWTTERTNAFLYLVLGLRDAGMFFTSFSGHIVQGR